MEGNSGAIECLILFYIDMKHILKTKQLVERVFMDQIIKHCKKCGFSNYSDGEIKNTWKNLISKYLDLKTKGTIEEKESWKYFEILDSCYEQSDFYNGVYPKFSEEMVWFLIECFLKRKGLIKTQKRNTIIAQIHKEFLEAGYLYITKQDIESKWKSLNVKYDKLKDDPESLKKFPYLQALRGFREENADYIAKMVFTRELTEILIERFTEKKITCVIHGYDSDQVLNEIQSEFKELGFYFSKEDIKEQWRILTNIYKFLIAKGKNKNYWVYFDAMKNHFKDNFLLSWNKEDNEKINEQDDVKPRRLRQRSKSVGAELSKKDSVTQNLIVNLEKKEFPSSSKIKLRQEEKIHTTNKKSVKRPTENRRRSSSRKKLKTREKANADWQKNADSNEVIENNCNNENQGRETSNIVVAEDSTFFQRGSHLTMLSIDRNEERRNSVDIGSPTSKVHIINIDQSDIDRKSGNLTINLPSITKQFSDNEFLPLKKRLRMNGDNTDKHSDETKEINDGFLGLSLAGLSETEKPSTNMNKEKRLTEEEMAEIMERIDEEKSRNCETNDKVNNENSTSYFGLDEFNNYQNMYSNLSQQCLLVPKEEHQDSLSIQKYANPNTMAQPPVLLLVIKVDGSNNPVKDGTPTEVNLQKDESTNPLKGGPYENNKEKLKEIEKQSTGQSGTNSQVATDFAKPIDSNDQRVMKHELNKSEYASEVNRKESSTMYNSSEVVPDFVNSNNSQTSDYDSDFILTESEPVAMHSSALNRSECEELHLENSDISDVCTVGENVTVYTTEECQSEQLSAENRTCDTQKTEEIIFREPLAVNKTDNPAKTKMLNQTSVPIVENNVTLQSAKPLTSTGKIRLPVRAGGKLKEIFISARELNKIAKLKPKDFKEGNSNFSKKVGETTILKNTIGSSVSIKRTLPEIKFVSQVVKPAETESSTDNKTKYKFKVDDLENQSVDDSSQSSTVNSKFLGSGSFSHNRNGKNEEFENESVLSEAVGDDGLKDNLLATVIDFQEQNNQEFIEIKNLMKQNNLLQRETNRLLRLMLERQ